MIIPLIIHGLTSLDPYLRLISHYKRLFKMMFTSNPYLKFIGHLKLLFDIKFTLSHLLRKCVHFGPLNENFLASKYSFE